MTHRPHDLTALRAILAEDERISDDEREVFTTMESRLLAAHSARELTERQRAWVASVARRLDIPLEEDVEDTRERLARLPPRAPMDTRCMGPMALAPPGRIRA